jgi:hypothetical protein
MSQPFIWIGVHKIKEGKLEEMKRFMRDIVADVELREPRLLAFNLYVNDEGTEVATVQVHPDAESFEFHMKVMADHIAGAYEYLEETVSTQIYGPPTEGVLAMIEQIMQAAGQKETLNVLAQPAGGFTRIEGE